MKTIIHPTYFPNIEFFSNLLKSKNLIFEINDFYQKQTFRNRASIYGSNGKLRLIIPVSFSSSKKEKLKDIRICNNSNWQKNHLKSIQIAYRSSPYFEFFEDYFIAIFEEKEEIYQQEKQGDLSPDNKQYFWMRNTNVPLDIIFINANLKIVDIYLNAQPNTLDLITSKQKAAKAYTNISRPININNNMLSAISPTNKIIAS